MLGNTGKIPSSFDNDTPDGDLEYSTTLQRALNRFNVSKKTSQDFISSQILFSIFRVEAPLLALSPLSVAQAVSADAGGTPPGAGTEKGGQISY